MTERIRSKERPPETSYIRILAYRINININEFFKGTNQRIGSITKKYLRRADRFEKYTHMILEIKSM